MAICITIVVINKILLTFTSFEYEITLCNFQPPSTASDIFRLASLMVYLITNGKTYIKYHEEAAVITSQSHPCTFL